MRVSIQTTVGDFSKKSLSLILLGSTSPLKFSLAEASVNWKFVTDAPDILLSLYPGFVFHAC